MSESARSEKYMDLTRFSTPVPELDDHRFHLDNQPRIEATPDVTLTRQNTAQQGITEVSLRPDLLQIQDVYRESGPFSRDFEQAVMDDDRSANDLNALGRRFSVDPSGNARHGRTYSRTHQDMGNRSRESSVSARSSSPPNSVDAFADPRRRERANTLESHVAPDLEAILQRTVSGGTRRPTFSNASVARPQPGDIQLDSSEDTCVPPFEEPGRIPVIDYEELEEFVALNRMAKPSITRRKHSLSSQNRYSRVSHDLRPNAEKTTNVDEKRASSAERSSEDLMSPKFNENIFSDKLNNEGLLEKLKNENDPTRFGFFSSESQSTVHAAELGDLVLPGDTFRDLFQLGPDGGVWWLDVLNPTEAEVSALSRAFSIHPLTTEDILTQESREKVELFKQYYFVCFRTFYQLDKTSERFMEPVNFYMVVFRDGVLSFSFTENPHAANVRRRIGKLRDYVALSSDWICYAMIFGPAIREIEVETEAIEDLVFIARMDDFESFLPRIGNLRKKVMSLMRLLGGKADVIRGFSKRCNEQYSVTPRGDIGLYLGDIQDHVVTMMSNLAHFEKMLSRSHTNYLAQLNVTNLVLGNHANKVLSKVTLIATILVPMNLICGLFGMNVHVPGQDVPGYGWFFGIVGVLAAVEVTPAGLPYSFVSFNGLLIDDGKQEMREPRELDLISRAPEGSSPLENNRFQTGEISMGDIQYWRFPRESMGSTGVNNTSDTQNNSSSKRASTDVYISLAICTKPILNESITSTRQDLPQLAVYVSTSVSLREPGPGKKDGDQIVRYSDEGYMNATVSAENDVYISVAAPNGGDYSGSYSYQLAASTDGFFHGFVPEDSMLRLEDSGSDAALYTADEFLSREQKRQWETDKTAIYKLFVNSVDNTALAGLSHSYCALARHSEASIGDNVEASISRRNQPGLQEQYYITGLNRGLTYSATLALAGENGTPGGGGKVYQPDRFSTKADGNCAVIYDLDFCSDVAHAVPSNSSADLSTLRTTYDDYATAVYRNFNYSLQQIQCTTSNESIFSMAVSCADCAAAYKAWLCAVTIPRCDDYSMTSKSSAVMIRNAAQPFPNGTQVTNKTLTEDPVRNRSRYKGLIDEIIRPGPYMEVLPNARLCHDLVRTCPMSLGFQCPKVARFTCSSFW
ncbi:stretch-activated Ca2+-permeable channel component-domain-containing protein [Aspergillus egyptiacus]|nr:stretch-activated Ca2+-permeable channel component-domain-containing protein [Aspergillus egyptiacus]